MKEPYPVGTWLSNRNNQEMLQILEWDLKDHNNISARVDIKMDHWGKEFTDEHLDVWVGLDVDSYTPIPSLIKELL